MTLVMTIQRKRAAYPAYRPSGIEWLGEIPEHWIIVAFKRLGEFQAGAGFPDGEQGHMDEEIPFYKVSDTNLPGNEVWMKDHNNSISRDVARKLRAYIFPESTIIFAKVGAALLLNKRRILTQPSCIDNNMMGFMPKACEQKWVFYWLCGLDFGELANPGAVPSINEGQVREIPVPFPPADEQRAIAAFLDRETARIDALIEKKRRQIELLREKRSALISHTVTKGLDPNAKIKDSGIEWLGSIPSAWTVARLRFLVKANPSKSEIRGLSQNTTVSFVPMEAVGEYGRLRLEQSRALEDVLNGYTYFRDGDIVIAKITPCFENGKGSIAEGLENGIGFGTTELHVLRPSCLMDRNYLFYLTISHSFRQIGAAYMYGAGGQKRVAEDFIRDFRHPIPTIDEQSAIAAFLDRETARIDALIEKVETSIKLLLEYRTALISEAVTGKIDVRKEVA